jgi:chemotaxis response regulator CheB
MPGAAWELGAAQSLHPLDAIAEKIIALASTNPALLRRDSRSAQG